MPPSTSASAACVAVPRRRLMYRSTLPLGVLARREQRRSARRRERPCGTAPNARGETPPDERKPRRAGYPLLGARPQRAPAPGRRVQPGAARAGRVASPVVMIPHTQRGANAAAWRVRRGTAMIGMQHPTLHAASRAARADLPRFAAVSWARRRRMLHFSACWCRLTARVARRLGIDRSARADPGLGRARSGAAASRGAAVPLAPAPRTSRRSPGCYMPGRNEP